MNAARHSGAPISRVRASDSAAANPAAWSWSVASPPVQATSVRAAVFDANGESIVSVGANGLARFDRGAWAPVDAPSGMDVRERPRSEMATGGRPPPLRRARRSRCACRRRGRTMRGRIPDRDITFHGRMYGGERRDDARGRTPAARLEPSPVRRTRSAPSPSSWAID